MKMNVIEARIYTLMRCSRKYLSSEFFQFQSFQTKEYSMLINFTLKTQQHDSNHKRYTMGTRGEAQKYKLTDGRYPAKSLQ